MARPTLLTPETQEQIVAGLLAGLTFTSACELANVHPGTGFRWLARGRNADTDDPAEAQYREFCDAIKRANAISEVKALSIIQRAAFGNEEWRVKEIKRPDGTLVVERYKTKPEWRAAAWFLERRFPEDWSKFYNIRVRIAEGVEAELEGALAKLEARLAPEVYALVLEALIDGETS